MPGPQLTIKREKIIPVNFHFKGHIFSFQGSQSHNRDNGQYVYEPENFQPPQSQNRDNGQSIYEPVNPQHNKWRYPGFSGQRLWENQPYGNETRRAEVMNSNFLRDCLRGIEQALVEMRR